MKNGEGKILGHLDFSFITAAKREKERGFVTELG